MRLNRAGWIVAALTGGVMLAGEGRAVAQTPPDGFVWYVLHELNGVYLDIEDPTNRPAVITQVPEGVLTPLEINGDGRTDWLIQWPDSSQFCGTGGCRRSLYISDGDGFTRAFDRQALSMAFNRLDGEQRIETTLHHLNCSDSRFDCRYAWAWNPATGRLDERPSSDGISLISAAAPVERGEGPDGETRLPDWTPQPLAEAWADSLHICPAVDMEGGSFRQSASLYDIADVNGDGLRDFVFAPGPGCDAPPDSGVQIWVTASRGSGPYGTGGDVRLAWTGPLDAWVEYDVATRPATVVQKAVCREGESCPSVSLRWDATTGRLVE